MAATSFRNAAIHVRLAQNSHGPDEILEPCLRRVRRFGREAKSAVKSSFAKLFTFPPLQGQFTAFCSLERECYREHRVQIYNRKTTNDSRCRAIESLAINSG